MKDLLKKIRQINKQLQTQQEVKIIFENICKIFYENMNCDILIVSKKGKLLCTSKSNVETTIFKDVVKIGTNINKALNDAFLRIAEIKENIYIEDSELKDKMNPMFSNKQVTIIPVILTNKRKGTMFIYKENGICTEADLIFAEYISTVIGLEIMHSDNYENKEETTKISLVKSAIDTLSYSELEAINHIFSNFDENEGLVVASQIAKQAGITRSIIVSAFRKLESAGIIESRSLGMKGTYIKVINNYLYDELNKD